MERVPHSRTTIAHLQAGQHLAPDTSERAIRDLDKFCIAFSSDLQEVYIGCHSRKRFGSYRFSPVFVIALPSCCIVSQTSSPLKCMRGMNGRQEISKSVSIRLFRMSFLHVMARMNPTSRGCLFTANSLLRKFCILHFKYVWRFFSVGEGLRICGSNCWHMEARVRCSAFARGP